MSNVTNIGESTPIPNRSIFSTFSCENQKAEQPSLDNLGRNVKITPSVLCFRPKSEEAPSPINQITPDTLEALREKNLSLNPALATLDKKAQKKARGQYLNRQLCAYLLKDRPTSILLKGLGNTICDCCSTLQHNSKGEITSVRYCKQRWCPVCESIRMNVQSKKLYTAIKNEVEESGLEPFFVTLTMQNVIADKEEYIKRLNWIKKLLTKIFHANRVKKNNGKMLHLPKGFWSIETTYNSHCIFKNGPYAGQAHKTYHPHVHLVVFGEENARLILEQWSHHVIKNADKITGIENSKEWIISMNSQDIRRVNYEDPKQLLELSKYSVKGSSWKQDKRTGKFYENLYPASVRADLYEAHYGLSLFKCFGKFSLASSPGEIDQEELHMEQEPVFELMVDEETGEVIEVPKDQEQEDDFNEKELVAQASLPNITGKTITFKWDYVRKRYLPEWKDEIYDIPLTSCFDEYIIERYNLKKAKSNEIELDESKLNKFRKKPIDKNWFNGVVTTDEPPPSDLLDYLYQAFSFVKEEQEHEQEQELAPS